MAVIKSVSITAEQDAFLDENDISASELLQASIKEAQENFKISAEKLRECNRKIAALTEIMNKQRDFMASKGVLEAFLNFKTENAQIF